MDVKEKFTWYYLLYVYNTYFNSSGGEIPKVDVLTGEDPKTLSVLTKDNQSIDDYPPEAERVLALYLYTNEDGNVLIRMLQSQVYASYSKLGRQSNLSGVLLSDFQSVFNIKDFINSTYNVLPAFCCTGVIGDFDNPKPPSCDSFTKSLIPSIQCDMRLDAFCTSDFGATDDICACYQGYSKDDLAMKTLFEYLQERGLPVEPQCILPKCRLKTAYKPRSISTNLPCPNICANVLFADTGGVGQIDISNVDMYVNCSDTVMGQPQKFSSNFSKTSTEKNSSNGNFLKILIIILIIIFILISLVMIGKFLNFF